MQGLQYDAWYDLEGEGAPAIRFWHFKLKAELAGNNKAIVNIIDGEGDYDSK